MESFPGERASTLSDNVNIYGAKIEEQKFRSVRERVSNLVSPEGARVRGGLVGFFRSGRVASE